MNLIEAIKQNNRSEFFRLLNLKTDPFGNRIIDEVDVEYGGSALYWAADLGYSHFIDPLLKAGADVNKPTNRGGATPVYAAARNGHAAIITVLKDAGANVDTPDRDGKTPVFIAAFYGHATAITTLKAAGAEMDTPAQNGETPLFAAVRHGHLAIVAVLLEARAYANVKAQGHRMLRTTNFETLTKGEKIGEDGFSPQPSAQHPSPLTFLYSNLGSILPASIIGLIQEYYVAPKELTAFLKLVAEGEQDKAEALLQSNLKLALVPGDVTDLSKRSFKDITALQYALWSLDWHMWTMLLKYIPSKDAAEQVAQSERGLWVAQHGVTANWENLIQAANQFVSEVRSGKPVAVHRQTWIKQVGGAQLLLPAHVINEYCHPIRGFDPVPDFSKPEATGAWRMRVTERGEWFSAKYCGGTLGEGFAFYRRSSYYAMPVGQADLYCYLIGQVEHDSMVSGNLHPPFHCTSKIVTLALTLNFEGDKKWYQQKHLSHLQVH